MVVISHDGRFVYLSVSGRQSGIVVHAVNPRAGTLRRIQRVALQGRAPTRLELDPTGHWLMAKPARSTTAQPYEIDPDSGKLSVAQRPPPAPPPKRIPYF